MSPGPTFERVYLELKRQLRDGTRPPGAPLEPGAIGDELGTSFTPVRDALHRLVGEGLVENPQHNGFAVPRPTEQALRDLYSWNGQIALLALRAPMQPLAAGSLSTDLAPAARSETIFAAVAATAGNLEHVKAVAQLNDRLAPYRGAEPRVFRDLDEELSGMEAALMRGAAGAARAALTRYHRRRIAAVAEILQALANTG